MIGKKTIFKGIISFPIMFLLFFWILFNHEYGHAFVAIQVGAEFEGFFIKEGMMITRVKYYNLDQLRAISVAGTIASLLTSIPLLLIGFKKQLLSLYIPAMIMIIAELIYWSIPFLEINGIEADSVHFLRTVRFPAQAFYEIMIFHTVMITLILFAGLVRQTNLKLDKIWLYELWL